MLYNLIMNACVLNYFLCLLVGFKKKKTDMSSNKGHPKMINECKEGVLYLDFVLILYDIFFCFDHFYHFLLRW